MSEALLAQWRDRVLEAEAEVAVVQEDISKLQQQRRALKQDIRRYDDVVQAEKRELLAKLEHVEAQAKQLAARCEATVQHKDAVEAAYVQTLDEYERLHYLVREIKADEERLASRDDVEQQLQRESLAWAEEEHRLRTRLNQLHATLRQQRAQQQSEVAELERTLAGLEQQQRQARAERARQQQQQEQQEQHGATSTADAAATQGSIDDDDAAVRRRATTTTTAAADDGVDNDGGVDDEQQQQQRRTTAVTLRSCLKPSSRVAVSAPVSRAASHTLVTDATARRTGDGVDDDRRDNSDYAHHSALLSQPPRAFSYAACERAARKRDVFGDATNRQS